MQFAVQCSPIGLSRFMIQARGCENTGKKNDLVSAKGTDRSIEGQIYRGFQRGLKLGLHLPRFQTDGNLNNIKS